MMMIIIIKNYKDNDDAGAPRHLILLLDSLMINHRHVCTNSPLILVGNKRKYNIV
jgi:hypothetical protein